MPLRVPGRRRRGCVSRRCRRGVVGAGEPEHGDGGAARRAARNRPGDGAEDRRLPDGARRVPLRRRARRDLRHRSRQARPAAGAWSSREARDRAAAGAAPASRRRLLRRRGGQRRAHPRLRARRPAPSRPCSRCSCSRRTGFSRSRSPCGRRLVVGRHAARRDRPQSPHPPAGHGGARAGRRHGAAAPLSLRHPRAGRAAPVRPPARDRADPARAARRPRACPGRRPRGARRPRRSARARERLRRADMAAPPRHPRRPARRPLAGRRPARRDRRRRRPAARVRDPRPLARQQRRAARRAARRRARRGRRAVAKPARPLPRLGPLPPPRRLGAERRARRRRRAAGRLAGRRSRGCVGQLAAIAAIAAYVLAVGAQPSVVRAGIAGALGSIAWLLARDRDRWWFLLVGAFVLLAWNPYTLFDAGLPAVVRGGGGDLHARPEARPRCSRAIPCRRRRPASSPSRPRAGWRPRRFSGSSSTRCRCSRCRPTRSRARRSRRCSGSRWRPPPSIPLAPSAAAALTWLAGWCAAYLAFCARMIGGLPFAQVRSGWAAAAIGLFAALAGAYAWRRCRMPS